MKRDSRARFPWLFKQREQPLCIAHRGASEYAFDNSLSAFRKAALLGADFWEVDVRTTSDGILVAYHDRDLKQITGDDTPISAMSCDAVLQVTARYSQPVVALAEVLQLARQTDTGVYIDAKDAQAVNKSPALLHQYGIENAVMACFSTGQLRTLAEAGCDFPLAVLVPEGRDPFAMADDTHADIIHLCWEHAGDRPQDLVKPALLEEAQRRDLAVVLWHEERLDIIQDILTLPVLGCCTNRPELLRPYKANKDAPVQVVCHRGCNSICPENTLPGVHCTFGAGYDYVELDVHATADGELVVIHDKTLSRTTNGDGAVAEHSQADIEQLDAGSWFDPFFRDTKVPRFVDVLDAASRYAGSLYVEIKTAPVCDVVDLVVRRGMLEQCFFWSFKQHYLTAIRKHFPDARIMTRRKDYPSLADTIQFVNSEIIEFDAEVDNLAEISACQQAGRQAMIAYNGADVDRFSEILDFGPDLINLNHPDVFRECLKA